MESFVLEQKAYNSLDGIGPKGTFPKAYGQNLVLYDNCKNIGQGVYIPLRSLHLDKWFSS